MGVRGAKLNPGKFLSGGGIWKPQRMVKILEVRRKGIPGGREQGEERPKSGQSVGHMPVRKKQARLSFTELHV